MITKVRRHIQEEPAANSNNFINCYLPISTPSNFRQPIRVHVLIFCSLLTWEQRKASEWNFPSRKSQCSSVVMRQWACIPTQHGRPVKLQDKCSELERVCDSWHIWEEGIEGEDNASLLLFPLSLSLSYRPFCDIFWQPPGIMRRVRIQAAPNKVKFPNKNFTMSL